MEIGFRPLFNQIVVDPDPMPLEDSSGLVLPERRGNYGEKHIYEQGTHSITGTVVACGDGYRITKGPRAGELFPLEVKPGDRILYARVAGQFEEIDGRSYQLIPEEHVYAVLDPAANVQPL